MKPLLLLLLAGACLAYTPITERSWVNFKNVQVPTYNSSLLHKAPNIIYAKEILIEERLNQVSQMIDKSLVTTRGDKITAQIQLQTQPHTEHQPDQPVAMVYATTTRQTLQTLETAPHASDAENKVT